MNCLNKLAIASFLFVPLSVIGASRNCTADEKAQANDRLEAIAGSQDTITAITNHHLPFGPHETVGHSGGEVLLYQDGYVMLHDEDLKTSLWASYKLTGTDRAGAEGKDRVNCFRTDPRFKKSLTATPTDYKESIYDQGHLANDADLKDDLVEQLNTYVMSNMSPQHCAFNRGIWLSMEELTRSWAQGDVYDELYVTSGAIFDRDGKLGRDLDVDARRMESRNNGFRVGVPSHYYKVIVRKEGGKYHSISFLLEHDNDNDGVQWNVVRPVVEQSITTVAEIEVRANIKLHPALDRNELTESTDGVGWDMSLGGSNFAGSLKTGNPCVDTLPE